MLFASSISCSSSTVKPEEISSSDMCEFCRMAISQKQFASEIILQDGSVRKFDDIGCMLNFRPALKGQQVAACFVVDYATREWLRADNAFYVRSQQVATPMSGGLIAFRDSSQAGQAAARYGGKVLKWSQLWI